MSLVAKRSLKLIFDLLASSFSISSAEFIFAVCVLVSFVLASDSELLLSEINELDLLSAGIKAKEEKLIKDATVIADAIKELEIKISAKTADSSKLFGSINNADVAEALAAAGQVVDKKFIKVEGGTIKRIGKYNATIRLHRSVVIELPIDIIAEAK